MGLLSLILPLLGNGGGPGRRDLSFPSAVSGSGFFIRLSGIPQCLTKLSRARPPSHSLCRNRTGCSRFCQILLKSNLRKCLQQPGLVWGQSQEPRTHSRSPTWGAGSQLLEPSRLPPRFALTGSWNLATFTCDMGVNSKAICPLRALPYPFKNKLWRRQCH